MRPFLVLSTVCGLLIFCGAAQSAVPDLPAVAQVRFATSPADFPNPERGFYKAGSNLDRLGIDEAATSYADGYRLLYARINLADYRTADLPAEYLTRLEAGFSAARQAGVKLIVRATYNYPQGETEYHDAKDASLAQVKTHLIQLKPLLERNSDVIAFVQAGFIGAWGEWHTSSNGLTSPDNRSRIRDALLDAVPATRFIQFRYPPYIQDWYPQLPGVTSAMKDKFRIGFHNDCFLASQTDVGTYSEEAGVRSDEQQFTDTLGDIAPYGGETCNPADDPGAIPRTACADIMSEGARYNLTYLNDFYYRRLFHDNWTKGGCLTDVRSRMGYRLALVSVSHPATASPGGALRLSIVVHNSGWARLYNPRAVEVILRDPVSGRIERLEAQGGDPRRWLPGMDTAETITINLPGNMAAGRREVWLALPDADSRLRSDSRFSVRPGNADDPATGQKWDAGLGGFALGTQIVIQ